MGIDNAGYSAFAEINFQSNEYLTYKASNFITFITHIEETNNSMNLTKYYITSLFIVSILSIIYLYNQVPWFGFISDDFSLVPLSYFDALGRTIHTEHFRPLWYLSYPLTNSLLIGSSQVHHGVNIVLHIINCILVILIFSKSLGRVYSVAVVLTWTLLPWVAFPIVWISQRNDLIMAFFILLSIYFEEVDKRVLSYVAIIFAFMGKVTCLFYPLAYCFSAIFRRRRIDVIFGVLAFIVAMIVSLLALKNAIPQEHIANTGLLFKVINHTKNFIVGWFTVFFPVPFFLGIYHALAYLVFLVSILFLVRNLGEFNKYSKKYLALAVLMSLPLAMTHEIRITYVQSLFLLAALIHCIKPHREKISRAIKIAIVFAPIGFLAFAVPSSYVTIYKFQTGEYDIQKYVDPPPGGYYPNKFYPWIRGMQIRLLNNLKHSVS